MDSSTLISLSIGLLIWLLPVAHVLLSSRSRRSRKLFWFFVCLIGGWLAYVAFLLSTRSEQNARRAAEQNLRTASRLLTSYTSGASEPDTQLIELLDHHDPQSAMLKLESLAIQFGCRPSLWKWLADAAQLMRFDDKVVEYAQRYRESLEDLKVKGGVQSA